MKTVNARVFLSTTGCYKINGRQHLWRMGVMVTHHLSLVSQWLSTSTTSPNTRPFIPCGVRNETEPSVLAYCRLPRNTVVLIFQVNALIRFLDLRPRVKGRSFHQHYGGAVVMREALSRHLCFLHLLAGFAVRVTTTHTPSSPSSRNCDSGISTRDTEGSLHT